jgi:DNA topoisomerase-2
VRDASVTQINGNAEINAIKQILGLQHGKVGSNNLSILQDTITSCKVNHGLIVRASPGTCCGVLVQSYDSTKQLRYGHLMIMTDQDHDGSHIKGLIMNFLHHFYPSLLKVNGFVQEFITPIVKVPVFPSSLACVLITPTTYYVTNVQESRRIYPPYCS